MDILAVLPTLCYNYYIKMIIDFNTAMNCELNWRFLHEKDSFVKTR